MGEIAEALVVKYWRGGGGGKGRYNKASGLTRQVVSAAIAGGLDVVGNADRCGRTGH